MLFNHLKRNHILFSGRRTFLVWENKCCSHISGANNKKLMFIEKIPFVVAGMGGLWLFNRSFFCLFDFYVNLVQQGSLKDLLT